MTIREVLGEIVANIPPERIPWGFVESIKIKTTLGQRTITDKQEIATFLAAPVGRYTLVVDTMALARTIETEVQAIYREAGLL